MFQTVSSVLDMSKTDLSSSVYDDADESGALLPEYNSDVMSFSKEGNNIVVILLDMCTGGYIPQIRDEIPAFDDTYSGFTWYPNSLSAGYHTSTSISIMRGGWNFHSDIINSRKRKKTTMNILLIHIM